MKKMLCILALLCVTLLYDLQLQAQNTACSDCGNLVISGFVTTDNFAGRESVIQLCAVADIPDLSIYYLTNTDADIRPEDFYYEYDPSLSDPAGEGAAGNATAQLQPVSLMAGECVYIVDDIPTIESYFNGTLDLSKSSEDKTGSIATGSGRETIFILCGGNIDDAFGSTYVASEPNTQDNSTIDGTSPIPTDDPAYHNDTWVLSDNNRCPNSGVFDINNWTVGPINDTDGAADITETTFPGFNFTHDGASCSSTRTCGGLELCYDITYECIPDVDGNTTGSEDFLVRFSYTGMELGAMINLMENYANNLYIDSTMSDFPDVTPDGTIVLVNQGFNDGSSSQSARIWGIEIVSPGCDGVQIWDEIPDNCILECSNGIQDGDETGIDCGGSCPNVCIPSVVTCDDGIMNGDETGIDCGGTSCEACPPDCTATASIIAFNDGTTAQSVCLGANTDLTVMVTSAGTSTNYAYVVTDGTGTTILAGPVAGPIFNLDAAPPGTCLIWGVNSEDDLVIPDDQVANITGCYALSNSLSVTRLAADDPACMAAPTCDDGIMNGDETGVDCGGASCEACIPMATCDDGIMNGDETGIDCGGTICGDCIVVVPTCDDGIMNGDETGVDCGGTNCIECSEIAAVPTMSQWGLIILMLLTLTFVSITVITRQGSLAGSNRSFTMSDSMNLKNYPFNQSLFMQAAAFVGMAALIAATGTFAIYGFLTMTDIIGTMIAGPIFAYLIHLLVMVNNTEK